jgi:hypothetical protein
MSFSISNAEIPTQNETGESCEGKAHNSCMFYSYNSNVIYGICRHGI